MEAFTLTEWTIVALVFVGGWLLGLASHSGGRKWRDRYAAERDAHATLRRDADAREAAARADADARVAAAEARHAELSREHDRLRAAAPVTAATIVPDTTTTTPVETISRDTVRPGETLVIRPGEGTETRRV